MTDPTTSERTTDEAKQTPTFEQAQRQLDQIVGKLENGEIGLAEAMAQYEQGVRLLKQCYTLLERAERRIQLLAGIDAEGQPITEPFDGESSASLDQQGEGGTRRRTIKKKKGRKKAKKTEAKPVDIDEPGTLF